MEWTDFLKAHGFDVATSQPSPSGRRIIQTANKEFIGVLLPRVRGHSVHGLDKAGLWTPGLFRIWGKTVGRLHSTTRSYQPSGPTRYHWNEERYLANWPKYVGANCPHLQEPWEQLIGRLDSLPRTPENYGLIHCDLHSKNFFIDGDTLQFFDTDDSHYNWFIYGVATIFLSVAHNPICRDDPPSFVRNFARHFWTGYRSELQLADSEIGRLPLFLKLRQYLLLGAVLHKWDFHRLEGEKLRLVERFRQDAEDEGLPLGMSSEEWLATFELAN
jgi:Ser/Thr protein kinase RdoA (MazF antagonist)